MVFCWKKQGDLGCNQDVLVIYLLRLLGFDLLFFGAPGSVSKMLLLADFVSDPPGGKPHPSRML